MQRTRKKSAPYLGRYENDDLKDYPLEHLVAEIHRRGYTYEDLEGNFRTLEFTQEGYWGRDDR